MQWDRFLADDGVRAGATALAASLAPAPPLQSPPPSSPPSPPPPPSPPSPPRLTAACKAACATADGAVALLERIEARHAEVSARAAALHSSSKAMADEASKLADTARKIGRVLAAYDSFYVIGVRLRFPFEPADVPEAAAAVDAAARSVLAGNPNLHGVRIPASDAVWAAAARAAAAAPKTAAALVPAAAAALDAGAAPDESAAALDRLDDALATVAAHAAYKATVAFLPRLRQLQLHALQAVRDTVSTSVRSACNAAGAVLAAAAAAANSAGAAGGVPGDVTEMSELHLRFRSELGYLRALLAMIEKRAARRVYAELARDCYAAYADARSSLLSDVLPRKLAAMLAASLHAPGSGASLALPSPRDGGASGGGSGFVAAVLATTRSTAFNSPAAVDAVRSLCAHTARVLSAEHALFHALFITPPAPPPAPAPSTPAPTTPAPSPSSAQRRDAFGSAPASAPAVASAAAAMPTHVRALADGALARLADDVASLLVDALRPLIVGVTSVDVLCDVVAVLRDEVIADVVAARGPQLVALARAAALCVKDAQERLAFLASAYVEDMVESSAATDTPRAAATAVGGAGGAAAGAAAGAAGGAAGGGVGVLVHDVFVPTNLGDGSHGVVERVTVGGGGVPAVVDYPAWLLAYYLRLRSSSGADAPVKPPAVFESWFPPVEVTLLLLSKLHRALEAPVFDTLAQDAAAACSRALLRAHAAIAAAPPPRPGSAPDAAAAARVSVARGAGDAAPVAAGTLVRGLFAGAVALPAGAPTAAVDADLFLIKNLLVLREQLSPFEVQLTGTSKSLDFSSTTEAFAALVAHAGAVFTMSRDNALLSFMIAGLPRVAERRVDCKAELEGLLRSACEAFIDRAARALTAHLAALPDDAPPAAVTAAAAAAAAAVGALLPALRRRMGLYLGSAVTSTILFRPIRDRVADAVARVAARAATPPAAAALLAYIGRVVEASNQLAVDPAHGSFGNDDAVLPPPPPPPQHEQQHEAAAAGAVPAPASIAAAVAAEGSDDDGAAHRTGVTV